MQTRFADDAVYLETNLRQSLNRIDTTYGVNVRHQLTPLTSLAVGLSRQLAQFEFSPDRDTTSTSLNASAAFTPEALVKGGATFGFTAFK